MIPVCRLDHSDPDVVPAFLCAVCGTSAHRTPEARAEQIAQEREARALARDVERKQREIRKAQYRVAALTRTGEPRPGTVSERILAALRRKIERLTAVS